MLLYNIVLVIARKRRSSPLMHHRRLIVRDFASEFFQIYIYLRTLLVSILIGTRKERV